MTVLRCWILCTSGVFNVATSMQCPLCVLCNLVMRQAFYNSGLSSDGDDAVSRSMVFIGFASMMRGVVVCQQIFGQQIFGSRARIPCRQALSQAFSRTPLRLSLELPPPQPYLYKSTPHRNISP